MATHIENINNHGAINIYNSEGKKLITKEEIEAQRKKEEKIIFSSIAKSEDIYINREVDSLLSNRIAGKKGCVLFLHGQGGIGKSMLLNKFSRTDRPTIFIHINEKVNMSMVDIFLDESKTTSYHCLRFEEVLDEIFIEKKNTKEVPFDAELKLLNAIKDDFGEHGVFVVDTLEKNKESHIVSNVKFYENRVRFARTPINQRFRDYLEKLVYLFVSHTTFIIAGRNGLNELNMQLPLKYVEEFALENFSILHIQELFSLAVKQDSKLSMPTKKHLTHIAKLTNGNPLLVGLFPKVAREYDSWDELDYEEMERRIKTDEEFGLLFYMTDRVLSHLEESKEVWKLVIPRVLNREIEKLLFKDEKIIKELIDVGLATKGTGKDSERYYLHDDVHRAIVAYYEREFKNGFSSWHDAKVVADLHRELMGFYEKHIELYGVNSAFEACYHKMMLREGFENDFEVKREVFTTFILGSLVLNSNKKNSICQDWNSIENSEIIKYIQDLKTEKDRFNISGELYDELSKALAHGIIKSFEDIKYLRKLSKDKFKKDWSIFYALGIAYGNKGEYNNAIEAYQKAVEINPKNDDPYNNMGIAYDEKGDYNNAMEAYQKVVEINPKDDKAYNNMGIAYYDKGEYDNAIKAFLKALKLNPKKDVAYYNMGINYGKKGEYDNAIEAFRKVFELNPKRLNWIMRFIFRWF